jgi:hypothetical protein
MFQPPSKAVDPPALLIANAILESGNQMLANLKTYRKEQYESFWFDSGRLRTADEINAILEQMDAAQIGQSYKFFASAVGLVQLILAIEPGSLQDAEWFPKYDYTTDPVTYAVRVIQPPEPEPEPEPDPAPDEGDGE